MERASSGYRRSANAPQAVVISARSRGGPSAAMRALQRTAGNRTIGALIQRRARGPQTKLAVNRPGDHYEQEADRVADQVMHMTAPTARSEQLPITNRVTESRVQRESFLESGWNSIKRGASAVKSTVTEAGAGLRNYALNFVRERAGSIPGYRLLTVILERDPISQQPVQRNASNLIQGALDFVPGGAAMFENLQRSGVLQRAYQWFNVEIGKLKLTWPVIRGLFQQAWDSLSPADVFSPLKAFERIRGIFAPPLERLLNFARAAGRQVLTFIFEGALSLAGSAGQRVLAIFRRIGAVFGLIVSDPVGFLGNLVKAVKGGFGLFAANIVEHLRRALLEWLFGALSGAGLQLPQRLDLQGIISIVLQVLGLTYAHLKQRLVKLIGERAVAAIETGFEFVHLIVTRGLAAAWQKILEFASGLVDTVIGGIRDWVMRSVVGAAVTKLATMLNPAGAVIQAVLGIYNTIMFVIERAQQIAAFVQSVVDSIDNIARGNISAAVSYVERTLGRILPLAINFLARLLNLGGIGDHIRNIINKIQAPINKALDKVTEWIVKTAKKMFAKLTGKGKPDERTDKQKKNDLTKGLAEAQQLVDAADVSEEQLKKKLPTIQSKYRLTVLELIVDSEETTLKTVHVQGEINPKEKTKQGKKNKNIAGFIEYGSINTKGQRSGISAHITKNMIGKGSSANPSIRPPGFIHGKFNHARGHLLGRQLGGSGSVLANLVTLYQTPVNTPQMSGSERLIRKAVEAGEIVRYNVTPLYKNKDEMPYAVSIIAKGNKRFSHNTRILNRE